MINEFRPEDIAEFCVAENHLAVIADLRVRLEDLIGTNERLQQYVIRLEGEIDDRNSGR